MGPESLSWASSPVGSGSVHSRPSHRPFGLCISSVMRRVPLTPFSTLTRKGFMYNSYIFALTCVMSGLDSFTVYSSHIYIVPISIGYLHSTFSLFCHRRLARNIFTLSLYLRTLLPSRGHSNHASQIKPTKKIL